jgi:hypothetical protein
MEIAKHVRFHCSMTADIFKGKTSTFCVLHLKYLTQTNILHLQSNFSHQRFIKKVTLNICRGNESVDGGSDVINSRNVGDCSIFVKRIMCAEIITTLTLVVLSCEYLYLFI